MRRNIFDYTIELTITGSQQLAIDMLAGEIWKPHSVGTDENRQKGIGDTWVEKTTRVRGFRAKPGNTTLPEGR